MKRYSVSIKIPEKTLDMHMHADEAHDGNWVMWKDVKDYIYAPEPIKEHRAKTQELLIQYGEEGTWGMNYDAWKIPAIKRRLEEDGIIFKEE